MSEITTKIARDILVYNTELNTVGNLDSVSSSATTWAELKQDLLSAEIPLHNMKAVIGEMSLTLDLDDAVLPD